MRDSHVSSIDDAANRLTLSGCILEKTLRASCGVCAKQICTVTVFSEMNPFTPKVKDDVEGVDNSYRVVIIGFNPKEKLTHLQYSVKVLRPHELCSVGHLRVKQLFDSFDKADFVRKYLESKFVRFCLSQQLPSDKEGDECFSCVPMFDVPADWQTEKLTDEIFAKKLYKTLGLTDAAEIALIESINPMDVNASEEDSINCGEDDECDTYTV